MLTGGYDAEARTAQRSVKEGGGGGGVLMQYLMVFRLQHEFALQEPKVSCGLPELDLLVMLLYKIYLCLRMQCHVHHVLHSHLQHKAISTPHLTGIFQQAPRCLGDRPTQLQQ